MGDINLRRITRTEALDQGFTDRQLAQLIRTGALLRVRPGEYALPAEWSAVESHRQHRELVLRTAERVTAPQIYSHHAAAALWGIRIRRSWPPRVDVLVGRAHGGRSSGRLRRWALGFEGREIVESDGLLLTSPSQTVIDLARELPFTDAVVVADSALGTAYIRTRSSHNPLRTHRPPRGCEEQPGHWPRTRRHRGGGRQGGVPARD